MQEFVYLKTYGCQMNENDSEHILGILNSLGIKEVNNYREATLLLINTCCVRKSAEDKVYGKLGEFKKFKLQNPQLVIGMCGCIPAKEGESLKQKFSFLDFLLPPSAINNLPQIISKIRNIKYEVGDVKHYESALRKSTIKTFVKAIEGCNYACSFCIVPRVRGKEVSRPPQEIYNEIKFLAENNFKEITLIGQNILSYGRDLRRQNLFFKKDEIPFITLLEKIHNIEGIKRIRFVTSHPRDLNKEIIKTINKMPKVCKYFHLPIQSGDDEILRLMKRGYSTAYYKKLIEEIRSEIPSATITTDIIVGFPGETEKHFNNTLNFIKEICFDLAFTFRYSTREGTKASNFLNQVPFKEKQKRLQILNQVQNEISLNKSKKFIGQQVEVLVEEKINKTKVSNEINYLGRTDGNRVVSFKSQEELLGKLVQIKIKNAKSFNLAGEVVI